MYMLCTTVVFKVCWTQETAPLCVDWKEYFYQSPSTLNLVLCWVLRCRHGLYFCLEYKHSSSEVLKMLKTCDFSTQFFPMHLSFSNQSKIGPVPLFILMKYVSQEWTLPTAAFITVGIAPRDMMVDWYNARLIMQKPLWYQKTAVASVAILMSASQILVIEINSVETWMEVLPV